MARSGARSLRDRRVVRASFEAPFDLVDDDGAVATLRPTPAHADQALALSDAFGEGFGRGAHRAIAFEVGLVFGSEALDNVVAGGGVGGIMENERIAEDAVFAVDVDGDFPAAGLAGRAGALVAEADGTGGFHGERSLKSAWPVASPYRLPGGELGWEESVSDRDPRGRRPVTGFASGWKAASRARPRRGDARHPKHLGRRAVDWGLAPSDMSRSDFDPLIHEIGELCELLLDVAFGPTAIDHQHRPRLPRFGDGDGW